jgi:spermidine/putrescine transport system permease protein
MSTGARPFFRGAAIAIFAFLYLPIAVLVMFSFQDSRVLSWPIDEWSLHWYRELLDNREIHRAILNSLIVGFSCVAVTTLGGVPLALALRRLPPWLRSFLERTLLLPLIIPQIITGLALLIILNRAGIKLSLATVILGQGIVWMPIVVTVVHARLLRIGGELEAASADLGANAWQTFFLITWPNIRTSVVGAALLVFTLSFDELPVTFFLIGGDNTLPMHIWSMMRIGITPEINAIATITVGVSIVLILLGMLTLVRDLRRS